MLENMANLLAPSSASPEDSTSDGSELAGSESESLFGEMMKDSAADMALQRGHNALMPSLAKEK